MNNLLDFSDKTVVVIGGTSGINRGIAELFARKGARVAVASRSQKKVDDTVESLRSCGAEAMGFCADVREPAALAAGLVTVHTAFGLFDVVVSGAAGNFPALLTQMSANAFRSVIDIDLIGTFNVMQAVYPYLLKPGASVVNISAPQATIPMAAQSHVCAAKAGVEMLTRCLALEWGTEGVRVNAIVPGPIDGTEGMQRLASGDAMREATRDSVPLRRLGTPQDVGNACLFLTSELGSYVNGAILPVDGGWLQSGAGDLGRMLSKLVRRGTEPVLK
ncbi:MAG: SDR family oxidoreductase [Desulfuromonadaceae bacterium]|nr:SDR family oxidoreductase [Desulfuromonadaceae bacterium]